MCRKFNKKIKRVYSSWRLNGINETELAMLSSETNQHHDLSRENVPKYFLCDLATTSTTSGMITRILMAKFLDSYFKSVPCDEGNFGT